MTKIHDEKTFLAMWKGPMTVVEIAAHYRMTVTGVRARARKLGFPSRGVRRRGYWGYEVEINGKTYLSLATLAQVEGLSYPAVWRAYRGGYLKEFVAGTWVRGRALPIVISGKYYPSMAQAARETGMSEDKIARIRGQQVKNGTYQARIDAFFAEKVA